MPRGRLACKLLGFVMDGDRAEAIVGDLTEIASSRGRLWFRAHALFIWLAYAAKSTARHVRWFAGIGIASLFAYEVVFLVYWGLFGFADLESHGVGPRAANPLEGLRFAPPSFFVKLMLVAFAANFTTGFFLGRFASRPDRNGALPLLVCWVVWWLVWPFFATLVLSLSWAWTAAAGLLVPVVAFAPLLLGALLGRPKAYGSGRVAS